jgi:hypothetical protein
MKFIDEKFTFDVSKDVGVGGSGGNSGVSTGGHKHC